MEQASWSPGHAMSEGEEGKNRAVAYQGENSSSEGKALSGPVLRREAELMVLPAWARGGMGRCWAVAQRRGRSRRGESQRPVLGPGAEAGRQQPHVIQAVGGPWAVSGQWAGTLLQAGCPRLAPTTLQGKGNLAAGDAR